MTISSVKYAAERASKAKTKKIGRRSISDILNDKPIPLSFDEKVNFIRHRFTWYEGNYDLFNDDKGKPNKRKQLLNRVISEVVLKNRDPSLLTKMNKKILIWRKDKLEKLKRLQTKEQIEKALDYRNHDWYVKTIINSDNIETEKWKNTIITFIKSPENNLDPDILQHIRYKRLKEIVNLWLVKKGMFLDYNSIVLNKYPKEVLLYDERKEQNA